MKNEAQSEPSTFSRIGNELQNDNNEISWFRLSLWLRDRTRWSSFKSSFAINLLIRLRIYPRLFENLISQEFCSLAIFE